MEALGFKKAHHLAALDISHQALQSELAKLALLDDSAFAQGYMSFVALLERDFHEEELLLEELRLPSLQSHREQHTRALSCLHHAQSGVMAGDIALGRHALELLPEWLAIHAAIMDQVLARALQLEKATPAH